MSDDTQKPNTNIQGINKPSADTPDIGSNTEVATSDNNAQLQSQPPITATINPNSQDDPNLQPSTQDPVVTSSQVPQKYGGKKIIATIFGILFLVASIATGVFLVERQQLTSTSAWDCQNYVFEISRNGVVVAINGSSRNEPAQQAIILINGNNVATLSVPALASGTSATLGQVDVPSEAGFAWRIEGTSDCDDSGSYEPITPELTWAIEQVCDGFKINVSDQHNGFTARADFSPTANPNTWQDLQTWPVSAGGAESHTFTFDPVPNQQWWVRLSVLYENTQVAVTEEPILDCAVPTSPPSLTPTKPPLSAQCLEVKIYDTSWNLLSPSDLESLSSGNTLRFAVAGSTNLGEFDMARFTVNGVALAETSQQKPESEYFFSDYIIPENTTSFSIGAQLHHTTLGWF